MSNLEVMRSFEARIMKLWETDSTELKGYMVFHGKKKKRRKRDQCMFKNREEYKSYWSAYGLISVKLTGLENPVLLWDFKEELRRGHTSGGVAESCGLGE